MWMEGKAIGEDENSSESVHFERGFFEKAARILNPANPFAGTTTFSRRDSGATLYHRGDSSRSLFGNKMTVTSPPLQRPLSSMFSHSRNVLVELIYADTTSFVNASDYLNGSNTERAVLSTDSELETEIVAVAEGTLACIGLSAHARPPPAANPIPPESEESVRSTTWKSLSMLHRKRRDHSHRTKTRPPPFVLNTLPASKSALKSIPLDLDSAVELNALAGGGVGEVSSVGNNTRVNSGDSSVGGVLGNSHFELVDDVAGMSGSLMHGVAVMEGGVDDEDGYQVVKAGEAGPKTLESSATFVNTFLRAPRRIDLVGGGLDSSLTSLISSVSGSSGNNSSCASGEKSSDTLPFWHRPSLLQPTSSRRQYIPSMQSQQPQQRPLFVGVFPTTFACLDETDGRTIIVDERDEKSHGDHHKAAKMEEVPLHHLTYESDRLSESVASDSNVVL
ncbi:hypothetical protein BC830DRAFT_344510 [Chytriomyces sp. MP71]|nr:hypothetical protein BC830DRAFT_344510 [Chytriomyces sp. MP71]